MSNTRTLEAILDHERARHPEMTVRDVQKLVYQSVFGGDHLLSDRGRFEANLRQEWDCLPAETADVSILQSIDPEGRIARIHLAPCAAAGVRIEDLVEVLWSQPRTNGARSAFDCRWVEVVQLARGGRIPFSAAALSELGYPEGFPHHSDGYGHTSYRIVNDLSDATTRGRLAELGLPLHS